MIYISSPYNHKIPAVRHDRFVLVSRFTVKMMKKGEQVYSPIAYGHQFRDIFPDQESRWVYWKTFDLHMLSHSQEMIVLMLPGWKESIGVSQEIQYAEQNNIPITYMEYTP